jgi:hypothetical protein
MKSRFRVTANIGFWTNCSGQCSHEHCKIYMLWGGYWKRIF